MSCKVRFYKNHVCVSTANAHDAEIRRTTNETGATAETQCGELQLLLPTAYEVRGEVMF